MKLQVKLKIIITLLLLALAVAGMFITMQPSILLTPTDQPALTPAKLPAPSSNITLLDVSLLDQNGTAVSFTKDVVNNHIIVMTFIYTDCKTACPVVSAIFAKLQNLLGDKLQHDVRLVSLSINPNRDTPANLKTYAAHFNARPEWIWLTGEKKPVDDLLKALKVYDADYTNHTPVILIGDELHHEWTRFDGFTSPKTLAKKIDELLTRRKSS